MQRSQLDFTRVFDLNDERDRPRAQEAHRFWNEMTADPELNWENDDPVQNDYGLTEESAKNHLASLSIQIPRIMKTLYDVLYQYLSHPDDLEFAVRMQPVPVPIRAASRRIRSTNHPLPPPRLMFGCRDRGVPMRLRLKVVEMPDGFHIEPYTMKHSSVFYTNQTYPENLPRKATDAFKLAFGPVLLQLANMYIRAEYNVCKFQFRQNSTSRMGGTVMVQILGHFSQPKPENVIAEFLPRVYNLDIVESMISGFRRKHFVWMKRVLKRVRDQINRIPVEEYLNVLGIQRTLHTQHHFVNEFRDYYNLGEAQRTYMDEVKRIHVGALLAGAKVRYFNTIVSDRIDDFVYELESRPTTTVKEAQERHIQRLFIDHKTFLDITRVWRPRVMHLIETMKQLSDDIRWICSGGTDHARVQNLVEKVEETITYMNQQILPCEQAVRSNIVFETIVTEEDAITELNENFWKFYQN
jgi:hypothetical protein